MMATFQGLPDLPAINELRRHSQWVAWKYEWRNGPDKKPTKPLISPRTGWKASHSKPETWGTYDEALKRVGQSNLPGIGFALSETDGLTGIDLDGCRDAETGEVDDWAQAILALAETYAEISPSGTGIRLFARGKVDKATKADFASVEIYARQRYMTVTGQHVAGTPTEINPAPSTLDALMARVEAMKPTVPATAISSSPARTLSTIPTGDGDEFFSTVNSRALQNLSSWVPQIFPTARLQPGTGAYRVRSRDLGRDLEEDLSLAPDGIVDFGVHDMGDPRQGKRTAIDICMEWKGVRDAQDAALWLCDLLHIDPPSIGWRGAWSEDEAEYVEHGRQVVEMLRQTFARKEAEAEAARAERAKSELEWFDDVQPVVDVPYIVKGLIDRGSMSVVYGPSNSGKTFFALDLVFHVAIAAPWRDRRVNGGAVLYLAAEGGNGIANRISALRETFGTCDVPFALRRAGLDLLKPDADTKHVLKLAEEVERRSPLAVIVVDTLSRVIAGGDENAASDMTAFIRNVDQIRQATGAHILIVHHTGKDAAKGARGHSSLRAATDTEIELSVDEFGGRVAKVTKQRDYEGGEEFRFALKSFFLAKDQDGDSVSTCIVEAVEKTLETSDPLPPLGVCKAMLKVIDEAWLAGNPLSTAPQVKHSGRYAARLLAKQFRLNQGSVQKLLESWLDNAVVVTATADEHTKKRGLRVLGGL